MLSCRSRVYCAILVAGILCFTGCKRNTPGTSATTAAQTASTPEQTNTPARRHAIFGVDAISPLIVSMTPETVTVSSGRAVSARYSLVYEIDHAEKAAKAWISIYVPGIGEVDKFDVEVQPRGEISFFLDTNDDLGPTVRFRAHCPYGDTDWFTMGNPPLEFNERMTTRQIGNVTPQYVKAGPETPGSGVPVTIWGSQLTSECTPEAEVDGDSVQLANVRASEKQIAALLSYSDLHGRPVVARNFEVKLIVEGQESRVADIYHLRFAE